MLGITLQSDETYGFPLLTKVNPTSSIRTQIPMRLQHNCWIVSINSQRGGHIEPISAEFCISELKNCRIENDEVEIALTFHRKIRPVATDLQTLRMMSDQASPVSPIVRHVAALPERPIVGQSIFECLKGPHQPHWIQGLRHQYSKNAKY